MRRALFHLVMFALFVPYVCASLLASLAAKFVHLHDRLEADMQDWSEGYHERLAEGLRMRLRAAYAQRRKQSTQPLPAAHTFIRHDDAVDDLKDIGDDL